MPVTRNAISKKRIFFLIIILAVGMYGLVSMDHVQNEDIPVDISSVENVDLLGYAEDYSTGEESNGFEAPRFSDGESGSEQLDIAKVEHLVHDRVNHERTNRGMASLEYNSELSEVARSHSADMVEREYFHHDAPDGTTPFDRVQASEVSCGAVGENIAQTFWRENIQTERGIVRYESEEELANGLVEDWMNSPGHRENILRGSYSLGGVGISLSDSGEIYATHKFCS